MYFRVFWSPKLALLSQVIKNALVNTPGMHRGLYWWVFVDQGAVREKVFLRLKSDIEVEVMVRVQERGWTWKYGGTDLEDWNALDEDKKAKGYQNPMKRWVKGGGDKEFERVTENARACSYY